MGWKDTATSLQSAHTRKLAEAAEESPCYPACIIQSSVALGASTKEPEYAGSSILTAVWGRVPALRRHNASFCMWIKFASKGPQSPTDALLNQKQILYAVD